MYIFLYPIEMIFAIIFYGPVGIITIWFSVLQQAGLVSAFIVTFLLMPEIQRVAFDAVLSRECADDVVLMGKLRRVVEVPFLVKCGQAVWALPAALILPFHMLKAIGVFIISAIPVIGPILVVLIQAPTKGLRLHARYFTLKSYDKRQIKVIYKLNRARYMAFGIVANALETIPIFSVFFMFTNTIGAALWVIDIENNHEDHPHVFASQESIQAEFRRIKIKRPYYFGFSESPSITASLQKTTNALKEPVKKAGELAEETTTSNKEQKSNKID
ncbi:Piso0_004623 [Millerozyma farinosa CBS 7064]|uniref:Piso0_004623 protein n=1 Tax=Pichia sorbitophila (strain ATCC MYA-4447 / BCRC 22081 / CBS 7064 / NBRC 10061 / NRRL Y-12695) TaxID=559304 RepID=G8Y5Z1_PICSO|nr:Piso0_004623 [Millerozyma farinosa CBS 7064]CCE85052.1 Piso0_004623 [Millerozyma farinosa CBS 7064]